MSTPARAPPPIQEGRPSPSLKARWRCTTPLYICPHKHPAPTSPKCSIPPPYTTNSHTKASCPHLHPLYRPTLVSTPVRAPPPIQEGRPSPSLKARWRRSTTPLYLPPQISRTNQPQVQYTAPYTTNNYIKASCPHLHHLPRPARPAPHRCRHQYGHRPQYKRGDRPHPTKPDGGASLLHICARKHPAPASPKCSMPPPYTTNSHTKASCPHLHHLHRPARPAPHRCRHQYGHHPQYKRRDRPHPSKPDGGAAPPHYNCPHNHPAPASPKCSVPPPYTTNIAPPPPIKANCPQCQSLHRPAPLTRSVLHQYRHWYRHRYQYQYQYKRRDHPHPSKPDHGTVLPQALHLQLTISGSLSVSPSISPKLRSRTGAARHPKAHHPTQGLTALSSAAPSFSCMSCDRPPKAAVNQHRSGPGRRLFQQSA